MAAEGDATSAVQFCPVKEARAARSRDLPAQVAFALVMGAVGIIGIFGGGIAPIWSGAPKSLSNAEIAALSAVPLLGGAGLLWRRTEQFAVSLLFVSLALWLLCVKLNLIVHAPLVEGTYQSFGMTAVILAAAWVLMLGIFAENRPRVARMILSRKALVAARNLFGISLVAFGLSHFAYLGMTVPLVPHWLPSPVFWAYFTGVTYLAAGAAVLMGRCGQIAAMLAALQMSAFIILVWLPMLPAGDLVGRHWTEFVNTCVLAVSAFVIARSYAWPASGRGSGKTSFLASAMEHYPQ